MEGNGIDRGASRYRRGRPDSGLCLPDEAVPGPRRCDPSSDAARAAARAEGCWRTRACTRPQSIERLQPPVVPARVRHDHGVIERPKEHLRAGHPRCRSVHGRRCGTPRSRWSRCRGVPELRPSLAACNATVRPRDGARAGAGGARRQRWCGVQARSRRTPEAGCPPREPDAEILIRAPAFERQVIQLHAGIDELFT